MKADKLIDELGLDGSAEVFVEINDVIHPISHLFEDSQGIYLVVDTDQEEREMR